MKFKYKARRPKRQHLGGISPSEFKTLLRKSGHTIARSFFSDACISSFKGRSYRWRWWSDSFVVDVSCKLAEFDRWANSTEQTVSFEDWLLTSSESNIKK
jgi:hypothetical protein